MTPPLVTGVAPLPRAPLPDPGGPAVREVERALLDTGLFRAANVNFEFDRAELLPSALPTLDAVGAVLERYPDLRLAVHGHTDSIGRAAYNLGLSERRAASVRAYLLREFAGITEDQLEAEGFGQEQPIAANDNPTGRALNRRVEFVVLEAPAARPVEEAAPAEETFEERVRRIIREEQEAAAEEGA